MHGSVRDELEDLLAAKPSAAANDIVGHIAECRDCAAEVDVMRLQARMLKTLRSPSDMEPTPGFYSRVIQRIERSARHSIWWVFVYSPIGKRIAYGSLALSLALGSYVVAAESNDGHLNRSVSASGTVAPKQHYDAVVVGDVDEQRSAVLANFVSHPASQPIATLQ